MKSSSPPQLRNVKVMDYLSPKNLPRRGTSSSSLIFNFRTDWAVLLKTFCPIVCQEGRFPKLNVRTKKKEKSIYHNFYEENQQSLLYKDLSIWYNEMNVIIIKRKGCLFLNLLFWVCSSDVVWSWVVYIWGDTCSSSYCTKLERSQRVKILLKH